jgi:hypothetical protein
MIGNEIFVCLFVCFVVCLCFNGMCHETLPFRGIYVVGIEAFICIYGKLLFPKQYVHPFFGEPENNLLSLEQ